ncbi:hypothetical protein, partial [Aeromonas salmonicida]|uniref:hypothetical protein n=1 Tax=Aeromonas salmonicida TaxID=645 RepID=UPI001A8F5F5D
QCGHWEENKKATIASGLRKSSILMVPEAGIEPARRERRGILNPDLFSFKSYSYDSFREYARSVTI